MEKDEIFAEIKTMLVNQFELEPEQVTRESNLFTDLDLDSIDAIDMVVYLQKKTGKKFSPEQFKTVRTINDVVEVVFKITHD